MLGTERATSKAKNASRALIDKRPPWRCTSRVPNDTPEQRGPSKEVVAARKDGLGGRLASMINAMRVAEVLELPFRFMWPSIGKDHGFNAISAVEDVFSANFIKAHHREFIDGANYIPIMDVPITKADLERLDKDRRICGFLIDTWARPVPIAGVANAEQFSTARLFARMDLSPRMREVVAAATEGMPLDNCVAVHARGGDLVYGENRLRLFNEKYTPLALLKQVVLRLTEAGRRVIVFSDDERARQSLKRKFGVVLASELGEARFAEPDRRALFEIVLMSRCKEIIAAQSAFGTVAGYLGQVKVRDFRNYANLSLTKRAILEDLEHADSDYLPLEAAKSYQYLASEFHAVLSPAECDALLAKAIQLDPDNTTYYHLRAGEALENGEVVMANAALEAGAERYFTTTGRGSVDLAKAFLSLAEIAPLLENFAQRQDAPYVCAHHSHFVMSSKGAEHALPFTQRAYESCPGSVLLLARFASMLIATKSYASAQELLQQAVLENADVPVLRSLLTDALEAQNLTQRAIEEARHAHLLLPDDAITTIKLAILCARYGHREEGEQLASTLSMAEGIPAPILYQYARLLAHLGDLRRALVPLEQAVRLCPNKPHYLARYRSIKKQLRRAEASKVGELLEGESQ